SVKVGGGEEVVLRPEERHGSPLPVLWDQAETVQARRGGPREVPALWRVPGWTEARERTGPRRRIRGDPAGRRGRGRVRRLPAPPPRPLPGPARGQRGPGTKQAARDTPGPG